MKKVFGRPKSLKKNIFHYCAGCGHSIAHRLIAEVIDELDIRGITIGIPPAGCAVLAYNYFDVDMIEAQHGRGPATATGMKRILPDRVIFSYQGDGDLAAIGIAESFHAANRGENITVISSTMPSTDDRRQMARHRFWDRRPRPRSGRNNRGQIPDPKFPRFSETSRNAYIERCTVNLRGHPQARKAIRKAFQYQIDGLGFSPDRNSFPLPGRTGR